MIRDFEHISDSQAHTDNVEKVALPERATTGSAGYDILSTKDFTLNPGEEILIPTGLKAYMLPDEYLLIVPRSSHGFKYYVRLANTVGIIDSDYYNNAKNEGHIWVKIRNESDKSFKVKRGEPFCQAIFQKFLITDSDKAQATRKGGIGSTDK